MPYVLTHPDVRKNEANLSIEFQTALFSKIKELIYDSFDELELYVVAPENLDESLNSENELLLTVCDILERIEQKLFD